MYLVLKRWTLRRVACWHHILVLILARSKYRRKVWEECCLKKTRLAFRANEAHLRLLKEIAKRLQNFLTSFVVRDARFVRDYDAVFHSHWFRMATSWSNEVATTSQRAISQICPHQHLTFHLRSLSAETKRGFQEGDWLTSALVEKFFPN